VSHPILRIVSIVYKEDNKWRLAAGESEYFAAIEDKSFWDRIHNGESLPEGTALQVEMVAVTAMSVATGKQETEHRITKVYSIIKAGRIEQLRLDTP
jgi:hypothetical protein